MKKRFPNQPVNRRRFLQVTSLATVLGSRVTSAEQRLYGAVSPQWRNRQPEMSYRQLGKTGMMISEVIQGGNQIRPDNYRHVEYAIERGLNYIDTAYAYGGGESERGVARMVAGSKRDRVFVASKVSLFDLNRNDLYKGIYQELPESEKKKIDSAIEELIGKRNVLEEDYLIEPLVGKSRQIRDAYRSLVMEPRYGARIDRRKHYTQLILDSVDESLRRLNTDYLDVMICPHGATAPEELEIPEIFEAYQRLKKAGKVRFLGVSSHNDPAGIVRAAAKSGHFHMAMVAYSIINGQWVRPAVAEATRQGLGVIAMKAARPVNPGRNDPVVPADRIRKLQEAVAGDLKLPLKAYVWTLQDSNVSAVNSDILDEKMAAENLQLPRLTRKYSQS